MPISTWESIANTPWWVYVIVGLILYFSLKARRPNTVPVYQLLILPVYLVGLAVLLGAFTLHPTADQYLTGAGTFSLGIALGWLQLARLSPELNRDTKELILPGSNLPLLSIAAYLIAKAYFGFPLIPSFDTDPAMVTAGKYNTLIFSIYGMTAGLALGRFAFAKSALKRAIS